MSSEQAQLHRSWLFVPGDRPERFDKAMAAGADAVIIDLEDAVPAAGKAAARDAIRTWLGRGSNPGSASTSPGTGPTTKPTYIRINAAQTEWFDEDLALASLP